MFNVDATGFFLLHATLKSHGFRGDAESLQRLMQAAVSDAPDRDALGLWADEGEAKVKVVAALLAHARKHGLQRHPERHRKHLTFWSMAKGDATRLGSVELGEKDIRLVFFRNSDCTGYLRVTWQGKKIERVRSAL